MMSFRVKLHNWNKDRILEKRGLKPMGPVQQFIDSEVMRRMDPYIPFRLGALKGAVIRGTRVGSGLIHQSTPYAKRQYFENKGGSGGLRGKMWFERMKADHKENILHGAAEIAGGRYKIGR